MACELFGAKLIAPFFGGSLYVWAAVLGVTLLSLMSGYYLGGYLSKKFRQTSLVYFILICAGIFMIIMPHTSLWIMTATLDFSVQWGTTISLMVFMFPALLLMGTTSPLIINLINDAADNSGKSAGSIYAFSTLGGICATFLVGFYLLPEFGIKWPCYFFGLLLALFPLLALVGKKYFKALLFLVPFGLTAFINAQKNLHDENYRVLYESEGILGQIKVVDMPYYTATQGWKNGRALLVNNTAQSIMNVDNPEYDLWDWSYFFPTAVSIFSKGSDALLLGLGGGTIVHQFNRLGFNTDVVEIDQRVKDVALKYFGVPDSTNIIVDDARRYLNTCKKKYDIITLDLFLNETPPSHVLTVECFSTIKNLLNPGGLVMMNFYGFISGEKGHASRCIYKTFQRAGFYTQILATPGAENNRNLIFLAQVDTLDFTRCNYTEPHVQPISDLTKYFIAMDENEMNDAVILSDEIPALEKIYLPAALDWRKSTIDYLLKPTLGK